MSLIKQSVDAQKWVAQALSEHAANEIFGEIKPAVMWTDGKGPNGESLVEVDPVAIVDEINLTGLGLLKGHDPGHPVGKVITAGLFTADDGTRFIAAVVGFYQGSKRLGFNDLGLGPVIPSPPSELPVLTDASWIQFSVDPREVETAWVNDALVGSPLQVKQLERSHNAADPVSQLIYVGLPYAFMVWNPFVKAIATEAGKDTYAAIKQWVKRLLGKLSELDNPIVVLTSYFRDCQVSFIVRGVDVKTHHIALEQLSISAQTAAALVHKLTLAGYPPVKLTYEYREDGSWFPSFAELENGKLITDNAKLIAVEKMPLGLSIGITLPQDHKSQSR